ncbi:MAG: hypothetical protein ACLSBB_16100 [Ruthenibacterium lactatiformans]
MKHAERVMQIINDALDTYTGFSKQESGAAGISRELTGKFLQNKLRIWRANVMP